MVKHYGLVFLCFLVTGSMLAHDPPSEIPLGNYFPEGEITWIYAQPNVASELVTVTSGRSGIGNYFHAGEGFERFIEDDVVSVGARGNTLYRFRSRKEWQADPAHWLYVQCVSGSMLRITDRNLTVTTPAGTFSHCIRVVWDTGCADAGITEEIFAPGVGLVRRHEIRLYGLVTWDLVSMEKNGIHLYPNDLSLECRVSPAMFTDDLNVICSLSVGGDRETVLTFPDGQTWEIEILNQDGERVYLWSEGKDFPQVIQEITVTVRTPFRFHVGIDLPAGLEAGPYTVNMSLPVQKIDGYEPGEFPAVRLPAEKVLE